MALKQVSCPGGSGFDAGFKCQNDNSPFIHSYTRQSVQHRTEWLWSQKPLSLVFNYYYGLFAHFKSVWTAQKSNSR